MQILSTHLEYFEHIYLYVETTRIFKCFMASLSLFVFKIRKPYYLNFLQFSILVLDRARIDIGRTSFVKLFSSGRFHCVILMNMSFCL